MSTWLDTNNSQPQVYSQTTSTDSASSTASVQTGAPANETGTENVDVGDSNLETEGDQFAQHEAQRQRQFAQLFDNLQSSGSSASANNPYNPDGHTTGQVHGMISKAGPNANVSVPAPSLVNKLVSAGATQTPEFSNLRNYVYNQTRPGSSGLDKSTVSGLAANAYSAVQDKMVANQANPVTRASTGDTQGQQGTVQQYGVNKTTNGYTADNVPTSSSTTTSLGTTSSSTFGSGNEDSWLNNSGPNALVYMVMILSLQEDNKDKAVYLNQINKYNIIGQQMGQYLSNVLEPAQVQLNKLQNAQGNNATDRDSQQVTVQQQYNWDYELWQNNKTGSVETGYQVRDQKVDSNGLSAMLKEFDQDQETNNNKRDQASNSFQAADQTSQQCFNMLSSFVKAKNDASNAVIRNIAS